MLRHAFLRRCALRLLAPRGCCATPCRLATPTGAPAKPERKGKGKGMPSALRAGEEAHTRNGGGFNACRALDGGGAQACHRASRRCVTISSPFGSPAAIPLRGTAVSVPHRPSASRLSRCQAPRRNPAVAPSGAHPSRISAKAPAAPGVRLESKTGAAERAEGGRQLRRPPRNR